MYLEKGLAQLAYPLSLSLLLMVLGLTLLLVRRRFWSAVCIAVATGWLWVWSTPLVSDALRLSLEQRYPAQPVERLPPADAIVVLGGAMQLTPDVSPYPDLGHAADRVWHAARLFHAGKAKRVIASGGRLPWQENASAEAPAMLEFLVDLGVPEDAVILEGRSGTTRENAVYTAELIEESGLGPVLLVTSALHMPRALAAFKAAGVEAFPAATDFEVSAEPPNVLGWLPDAEALSHSTRALKEYLGYWVYRWRGWVRD